MTDRPDEIIAEVLRRDAAQQARAVLRALHDAGYRVVTVSDEPSLFDEVDDG